MKTITISMIIEVPEEQDTVETVNKVIHDIESIIGPSVRLHVSDDDQDYIDR